ncbi:YHS domain-containing (seleno)protein [Mesorhizobium sangaii]|uniref:YHS domain-containing protein n=1 Tax=Mesorhizobium sangaii TaxID=505389 RepID=A0A841P5J8_9HYPH|nr:YHS domain-containing (seleno)protein [Mesorhizobium sangaii]MBB6408851.1 YHS domain-containing protein [Mesorhizobium sangaii]
MTENRSRTFDSLLCAGVAASSLLLFGTGGSHAGEGVNTGYFGNVAILGYDPVAYFTDGRATMGSPKISRKWLGATWYFASVQHREAFVSEPVRYAPQFGGFCTGGMSVKEASANLDPEAFRIVDGKLFLFSGKEGLEEDFDANPAPVIAKAEAEWPAVEAKEFEARAAAN